MTDVTNNEPLSFMSYFALKDAGFTSSVLHVMETDKRQRENAINNLKTDYFAVGFNYGQDKEVVSILVEEDKFNSEPIFTSEYFETTSIIKDGQRLVQVSQPYGPNVRMFYELEKTKEIKLERVVFSLLPGQLNTEPVPSDFMKSIYGDLVVCAKEFEGTLLVGVPDRNGYNYQPPAFAVKIDEALYTNPTTEGVHSAIGQ